MREADMTGSGDISYEEWIQYLRNSATNEKHREMATHLIDQRFSDSPTNQKTIAVKSSKKMSGGSAGLTATAKEQVCCCIH
eukprot:symbB.v1.2.030710.t1/scaffold3491.1/size55518/6